MLLGLPLAAVAMALLLGWIREGRMPRWLPAVGVAVLLVDLLAAGGIGLPGVAGTFWLLLALGLQGTSRPRELPHLAAWAALAGGDCLGRGVLLHGVQARARLPGPVATGRAEPTRAVEHLEAAAAADPLSAEPGGGWRRSGSSMAATPSEPPSSGSSRPTRRHCLAPNSALAWLASGDWYFQAAAVLDHHGTTLKKHALDKAAAAYREAVRLYPNDAPDRAPVGRERVGRRQSNGVSPGGRDRPAVG